jgi:hypothetical protein
MSATSMAKSCGLRRQDARLFRQFGKAIGDCITASQNCATFSKSQLNWPTITKEMFGVWSTVRRTKLFVALSPFVLSMDHRNLLWSAMSENEMVQRCTATWRRSWAKRIAQSVRNIRQILEDVCTLYNATSEGNKGAILSEFRAGLASTGHNADKYMTTVNQICKKGMKLIHADPGRNKAANNALAPAGMPEESTDPGVN